MSYYLRTASENLNNILSTESISPASLYPKRMDGYRYFQIIDPANPLENEREALRLYRKLPSLKQPHEDCSIMAIKIPDSATNSIIEDSLGRIWSTQTIYLEPKKNSFSFIFENEKELSAAFNSTKKSIESKFSEEYRQIATVADRSGQQSLLEIEKEADNFSDLDQDRIKMPPEEIAQFENLDKIKGIIYCYQLDKTLSVPGDRLNRSWYMECMQAVDKLVNLIPQKDQSKTSDALNALEEALYHLAEHNEHKRIEKTQGKAPKGPRNSWHNAWLSVRKMSCVELPKDAQDSQFALSSFRNDLELRIRGIAQQEFAPKSRGKLGLDTSDDTVRLVFPYVKNSESKSLAEHMLNWIAANDVYREAGGSIGYNFARLCGAEIKAFLGDDWAAKDPDNDNAQSCQDYINSLLKYLNEASPFDFDKNPEIKDEEVFETLRSLALFCAKSSNKDLESFYRYLSLKHSVSDLRLPLSIWGATFGFSQMPKTLCDQMDKTSAKEARELFREATKRTKQGSKCLPQKNESESLVKNE